MSDHRRSGQLQSKRQRRDRNSWSRRSTAEEGNQDLRTSEEPLQNSRRIPARGCLRLLAQTNSCCPHSKQPEGRQAKERRACSLSHSRSVHCASPVSDPEKPGDKSECANQYPLDPPFSRRPTALLASSESIYGSSTAFHSIPSTESQGSGHSLIRREPQLRFDQPDPCPPEFESPHGANKG